MENKTHALAAGAFVLVLAALLVAMAAWLTRDHTAQRVFEISANESVTGLQPQAGVRYKGVLVGRVLTIGLDPVVRGNVLLRIAVNEGTPVTASTWASLGFQGVTGLAFVQLEDSGESNVLLSGITDITGTVARIPMRQGLVSRFTEQGTHLLNQLDQASQKINYLLDVDNQKNLMQAISNLGQAATDIRQLTQHADAVLTGTAPEGSPSLPRISDQAMTTLKGIQATSEQLRASAETVRDSATEFRRMSVRMSEPGGTLDRIGRSTEALVNTSQTFNSNVVPRLNRAADETARAARQAGRVLEGLSDTPQMLITGKGTVVPGPGEPGFATPSGSGAAP